MGRLAQFLKRVVIETAQRDGFRPAKSMVEKGEIEQIVGEFRWFLEATASGEEANQHTIREIR